MEWRRLEIELFEYFEGKLEKLDVAWIDGRACISTPDIMRKDGIMKSGKVLVDLSDLARRLVELMERSPC